MATEKEIEAELLNLKSDVLLLDILSGSYGHAEALRVHEPKDKAEIKKLREKINKTIEDQATREKALVDVLGWIRSYTNTSTREDVVIINTKVKTALSQHKETK